MNKNRYKVVSITDTEDGEMMLIKYIPEPGDPKHDDLPSEQFHPGDEFYLTAVPVKKEPEEPFNK